MLEFTPYSSRNDHRQGHRAELYRGRIRQPATHTIHVFAVKTSPNTARKRDTCGVFARGRVQVRVVSKHPWTHF